MKNGFGWDNFLLRLGFATILVAATYNPSGYSFYHWAIQDITSVGPDQAVAGIVLLIGWIIYLRATLRSLGVLGVSLARALFAALIWLLVSWKWISPENPATIEYLILAAFALVLGLGMSWSYIRRRLSGQLDVDDVED